MEVQAEQVQQYLEARRDEMNAFLHLLVATETPSRDARSQDAIFKIFEKRFFQTGYAIRRWPGKLTGGYLIAKPRQRMKKQPLQLLIGHCDTVWAKGTLQNMPFEEVGGHLRGPGIFDMKAGLTQMVFALQTIRDLGLTLPATPVCLINSDEEIGSRESTPAIRRLAKIADRAYVLEPPLGLDGKLKTARKGLGRFTLTVKGKAAHAGLNPGEGASAILELSHQIQKLFALNDPQRGITVNVGVIEGGMSPNVVAPESKAVADVRVPTLDDVDELTQKIMSLQPVNPGVRLEVEGGFGRPPMEKTPRNEKLWLAAREAAYRLGLNLQDGAAGGGSDANTTSLYTATLDGLGATGDGAHAAHEFIFLEKLLERTALLVLLLLLPPLKGELVN